MTSKEKQTAKLIVKVQTGTNASGSAVYRQRNFAGFNPALSDDDAYAIGTALGALQSHPVEAVTRQDASVLVSA